MKKKSKILIGFIAAWCAVQLLGLAPARALCLTGPEVVKLDWNTRAMTAADVNADGLTDIIVIDNDTARVMILYQTADGKSPASTRRIVHPDRWEPVLEDARFQKGHVVTGLMAFDLAAGDLNGDGRVDLAYTGNTVPLTIRFQGEEGEFSEEWTDDHIEPLQWSSCMQITDIDSDGSNELIVLASKNLYVYRLSESGRPYLWRFYRLSDERAGRLWVADINGDRRRDILYMVDDDASPVMIRLQDETCDFGPEIPVRTGQAFKALAYLQGAPDTFSMAAVSSATGLIRTIGIEHSMEEASDSMQLNIYSSDIASGNTALYAAGDFNGDGLPDMAAADPGGARVLIYFRQADARFKEAAVFPSFSHVSALSTLRKGKDKPDALLLVSEDESVAGISEMTLASKPRLNFPVILKTGAKPLIAAAIEADGGRAGDEIVLVEKTDQDSLLNLRLLAFENGDVKEISAAELNNIQREPRDLFVTDLNNDRKEDLLMMFPREPARIFIQKDGNLVEVCQDSAIRKGTLDDLNPARLGSGDSNNDGADELLVSADGYVRALQLNEKNELTIIDQFNSAHSSARLEAPEFVDIDGDGRAELLVMVPEKKVIEVLNRQDDGIYRSRKFIEIGDISLSGSLIYPDPDGVSLIYLGKDRFWEMAFGRGAWAGKDRVPPYETDLKDVAYTALGAGEFDGVAGDDLIAVDGQNHVLELLTAEASAGYKSRLHFTIFDQNLNYGGRRGSTDEPREMLIDDFSADGKDDIALLVHDRILLYIQK